MKLEQRRDSIGYFTKQYCITESFPDVEHKYTAFLPNYELQTPDADMNWFGVQNEKECCELMRRNDNASAYHWVGSVDVPKSG